MAEIENVQTDPTGQEAQTEQSGQVSQEDYQKLQGEIEHIKAAQSGSDKRVATLQDKIKEKDSMIEELKKAQMTPEEKLEYEKKLQSSLQEKYDAEKSELERKLLISDFVIQNNLDPEMRQYLTADTEEGLKKQAENLQEIINKAVSARLNQTTPPAGGSGNGVDIEAFNKMSDTEKHNWVANNFEKAKSIGVI